MPRGTAPSRDPETAAIAASGLYVSRGRTSILRGLEFNIGPGRITGLLGPSGSGKTTLMRAIVGVQKITSGTLSVLGRPAGRATLRHDVGYVTQGASVYGDLSVEANVKYFGAMHGATAAEVAQAISAVGLGSYVRRKAADLSGGQFSRIGT